MKKDTDLVAYNLRMPPDLKKKLEKRAKTEKRSLNQQLIHMLEASLQGRTASVPA